MKRYEDLTLREICNMVDDAEGAGAKEAKQLDPDFWLVGDDDNISLRKSWAKEHKTNLKAQKICEARSKCNECWDCIFMTSARIFKCAKCIKLKPYIKKEKS